MKLVFLFLTLFCLHSFGQTKNCDRTISGQVLDIDTNEPLPYATIKVAGTTLGAVADEQGRFTLTNICEDEIDIEIRFIGYKSIRHHHDFHHPNPVIYMAADELLLESVVVEAEQNAHEQKTLNPKNIAIEKNAGIGSSAGDLLSKASGVSTLRSGQNVVKPMIHGLHSNRVLLINNGVRHSYQAWGSEHAPEIDPSQIESIRLIKGASTVRYGPDALGGVVLFDSPIPKYNRDITGEVGTFFQTNGRGYGMEAATSQGYERSAWRFSVNASRQGDLRAPTYFLTNTGKSEWGYSITSRHHFSWIDLDLLVSRFQQELGVLRGSVNENIEDLANAIGAPEPNDTRDYFSYQIRTPRQETVHDLIKLKAAIFLGEQQFDFQYAWQKNVRKEFDIRRGTNNDRPAIDLSMNTHTIDIDWDHPSNGNWKGTFGTQFFYQDNNNLPGTNTIPFVPNYNNINVGVFAIESYSREHTTYEAGLRFDFLNMNVRGRDIKNTIYRHNNNYQNFTFTAGVIHQPNKTVTLRSNIGSAWRAPNISELYSYGKHRNVIEYGLWRYEIFPETDSISTQGVLTDTAKPISSERGLKWISSLTITRQGFQAEITPYINWIQNYFYLRPYGLTRNTRGPFPYFIHDQTDALYMGVDLDFNKQWNETLEATITASYVFAKDIENNQPFIGIPPYQIQMDITKKLKRFAFTMTPSWTGKQTYAPPVIPPQAFISDQEIALDRTVIFDFLPPPEAFFLMNASIKYENGPVTASVTGENIFNTRFRRYTDQLRYFADDLGWNLRLYFSYSF